MSSYRRETQNQRLDFFRFFRSCLDMFFLHIFAHFCTKKVEVTVFSLFFHHSGSLDFCRSFQICFFLQLEFFRSFLVIFRQLLIGYTAFQIFLDLFRYFQTTFYRLHFFFNGYPFFLIIFEWLIPMIFELDIFRVFQIYFDHFFLII